MTEQQAMRMALLALELWEDCFADEAAIPAMRFDQFGRKAITALRQALEQQPSVVSIDTLQERVENSKQNRHEQQPADEPVAWLHRMDNTEGLKANRTGIVSITQKRKHPFGKPGVDFSKSYPVTSTPLYIRPQPAAWVGLTDEEISQIEDEYIVDYRIPAGSAWNFAKDIEAKLKEKNT